MHPDNDPYLHALNHIASSLNGMRRSLHTIERHMLGGLTAEEVSALQAQANKLTVQLDSDTDKLQAAITAANKGMTHG